LSWLAMKKILRRYQYMMWGNSCILCSDWTSVWFWMQLLSNYIGDDNLRVASRAIAAINNSSGAGPCIRGLVICSCGSTGRVIDSVKKLTRLVERCVLSWQQHSAS
jgi:hypothetical protein